MRRIGLLLTLVTVLILAMASPAGATALDNSGKGMNRQGGPSEHPGKGWKDPGQDQGSPANTADPDCTGNRTRGPQATNIGDCDDLDGTADEPAGPGGFDADKDWNNGCGNDTDFEDDNNGQCRGPVQPTSEVVHPPKKETPPTEPPDRGRTEPSETVAPPEPPVLQTTPPTPAPEPVSVEPQPAPPATVPTFEPSTPRNDAPEVTATPELPFTGAGSDDLTASGLALVALGSALVRWERRRLVRSS